MTGTPDHTAAMCDAIRRAGFNIGTARFVSLLTGRAFAHVDATSTKTGETFIVHALTEHEALAALAGQIGVALLPAP